MNINNEPTETKAAYQRSMIGRWLALSFLLASTSLPTACLPAVDVARAVSPGAEKRVMYCPPDQEPTSTPRLALLPTTTPTLIPTQPVRPIESSPRLSPKPTFNPHANTYGEASVIEISQCYDTDPFTGIRVGPSPAPTRIYTLFPPSPQKSPEAPPTPTIIISPSPSHTPYGY